MVSIGVLQIGKKEVPPLVWRWLTALQPLSGSRSRGTMVCCAAENNGTNCLLREEDVDMCANGDRGRSGAVSRRAGLTVEVARGFDQLNVTDPCPPAGTGR